MRVLIHTDVHAGEGIERCFSDPTIPLQRYRVTQLYEHLDQLSRECHCDAIWDGGDTTDDRTSVPIPTIASLLASLRPFRRTAKANRKIVGNHEHWVRSGDVHVGPIFENVYHVIDKPTVEVIAGVTVLFCPYPGDDFDLDTWLEMELDRHPGKKLVFGHFQVEGTRDRDGAVLPGGVRTSVLKKADLVLLGHIHHPQSVTPTIHYIGTPFQQDFGEAGEAKRVAILNLPSLDVEWVELSDFPEYQELEFAEWAKIAADVGQVGENRFRVRISSLEDHESYIRHPHMRRTTPIYRPTQQTAEVAKSIAQEDPLQFDTKAIIQRYFETRPPAQIAGTDPASIS